MSTALATSTAGRCCRTTAVPARNIVSVNTSLLSAAASAGPSSLRAAAVAAVPNSRGQRRDVRAAFFNFGKNSGNAEGEGVYGHSSSTREDYTQIDLEDYFNYMGILAEQGNYDSLESLVKKGLQPVDCILLLACGQNDQPKVEEVLKAGADVNVVDAAGRSASQLATKPEILAVLKQYADKQPARV